MIHGFYLSSRTILTLSFIFFRGRAFVDGVTLVLFCLTWIFGLYCIIKEADFAPQFFFCIFLSCTVKIPFMVYLIKLKFTPSVQYLKLLK